MLLTRRLSSCESGKFSSIGLHPLLAFLIYSALEELLPTMRNEVVHTSLSSSGATIKRRMLLHVQCDETVALCCVQQVSDLCHVVCQKNSTRAKVLHCFCLQTRVRFKP